MSLSGSYDNTTTAKQIIRESFSLINAHDDTETLPPEMWAYGLSQLNKLMSFLSIHPGLWLQSDVEITLTPGTTSYTLGPSETVDTPVPMEILLARRSESIDIPIDIVSRADYMAIPNKTLQAPANMVYYHKMRDTGELYVWPTGTSNDNTIKVTTSRRIQDFDSEGNNPDFPKEWTLAVEYLLAEAIAPKYKGAVPQDIRFSARQYLNTLIGFDSEKTEITFEL